MFGLYVTYNKFLVISLQSVFHNIVPGMAVLKCVYYMTLLVFSGSRHVINNVMTTNYITLSAGTSNVMTMSIQTMQNFRFCRLLIFFQSQLFEKTISGINSLDPDQDRGFVGPDLGPNCLQKLPADDTCMQRVNFKLYFRSIQLATKHPIQTS